MAKRPRSIFRKPLSQPNAEYLVTEDQFHYCEYYYSCREHPCENLSNTFQKSHDFDLKLPVASQQRYLIQFRIPLGLLISWFELRLPRQREVDSPEGFVAFVKRNQGYLNGFRSKWIESSIPDRLLLDYDSYLKHPSEWLTKIVSFFDHDKAIDSERIDAIVSDVRPPKNNRRFRYYDAVSELCLEQPLLN